MRSLFEISEDLAFLEDFLTDTGGDITDEAMEAEIDKGLGDLGEERDTKIDNYCALYREFIHRGEARNAEAARMAALGAVDINAGERLKARLFNFFDTHGIDRVDTARFRVTRVNNGGALPILLDKEMEDDPEKLPETFRKTIYVPEKTEIGKALVSLEASRLRFEAKKEVWDALLDNMNRVMTALENRPADDTEEARKALEEELAGFQAVHAENLAEYQAAEKEYQERLAGVPFARFGRRGKHLRIK
jgi:hypothetical protein